jgi:hypothetical protein
MARKIIIAGVIVLVCGGAWWIFSRVTGENGLPSDTAIVTTPPDLIPIGGTVSDISPDSITIGVDTPETRPEGTYMRAVPRKFTITDYTNIVIQPTIPVDATGSATMSYLGGTNDVVIGARVSVLYSASDTSAVPKAWSIITLEHK